VRSPSAPDARTGGLGLIGNTPLLPLARIASSPIEIYAKAEFVQPGGSVKDRAALEIVRSAYAEGRLVAGRPVVEMTSGNMGAGLAVVCNVHGNPFTAVMSAGNSPERAKMMRAMGAEVILVPQVDGQPGQVTGADIDAAERWARQLARDRDGFYVDQFNNPGSVRAHETGTGPEIWNALGGRLDGFVAAVGSGGTFVGTARYLKRMKPAIVCAAVEPEGAQVLAGRAVDKPRHLLQGTGYGIVPPQWQAGLADVFLAVSDDEAEAFRRRLALEEGLYVGYSAAANVCAAIKLAASGRLGPAPVVATVLCDTGFKY
jgi:cysteine synthase A